MAHLPWTKQKITRNAQMSRPGISPMASWKFNKYRGTSEAPQVGWIWEHLLLVPSSEKRFEKNWFNPCNCEKKNIPIIPIQCGLNKMFRRQIFPHKTASGWRRVSHGLPQAARARRRAQRLSRSRCSNPGGSFSAGGWLKESCCPHNSWAKKTHQERNYVDVFDEKVQSPNSDRIKKLQLSITDPRWSMIREPGNLWFGKGWVSQFSSQSKNI